MIEEKNKGQFKFVMDNGLIAEAPAEAKVYVHVTDNGNGTHLVNGKLLSNDGTELGWIRTNVSLPSDTINLLEEAHTIIKSELIKVNSTLEFTII